MKLKAHYISGTHWDREWYRPFQEFRLLLVEVLDNLIDTMEKESSFKYFHLDGQTCLLEDYIEINPTNYERLKRLIQNGRILIGPWFTMPDLFSVSEESLIRNLLLGKRISEEWGVSPMSVGYTCDMFGHPSAMPMIFNGFDIKTCVLGRGTIENEVPSFFQWKYGDNSVLVFKLQDELGYGAFIKPRNILEYSTDLPLKEKEKEAIKAIRLYIEHEVKRTNGEIICLFDSMDHKPPASDTNYYLELIEKSYKNIKVKHSNLVDFFDDVELSAENLPVKQGELRHPSKHKNPYNWLIPNCTSSRISLKIKNDECQNRMKFWVEPYEAFATLDGLKLNRKFLEKTWKYILLNHAHDSICGCSIDQVHRDMKYRYDQAEILGKQLISRTLGFYTQQLKELSESKDDFTLMICNPLPEARDEVTVIHIDFPIDYPKVFTEGFGGFGAQKVNSFIIYDSNSKEIHYQLLNIEPSKNIRTKYAITTSEMGDGEFSRYTIALKIKLPSFGFKCFRVSPSQTPKRDMGNMLNGPNEAENEFIILNINPNGSFNVYDKTTNELFRNLLIFEDKSEIGSGWFHSYTQNEEIFNTSSSNIKISVIQNGTYCVKFKVSHKIELPAKYDHYSERRSNDTKVLKIDNFISLYKETKYINIETIVHNNIEDHLLRVLFQTEVYDAKSYYASSQFDFIKREIKLNKESSDWQECEITPKPFNGILQVQNKRRGLSFISEKGIHEGGIRDDKNRTMDITLLRSFKRTVGTSGETDGQELGQIRYNYAILPNSGDSVAELYKIQDRLQAGITTIQSGQFSSAFPEPNKSGLSELQLLEFNNKDILLTAIKTSEDGTGLILRFWNSTDKIQKGKVKIKIKIKSVFVVKLNENKIHQKNNIKFDTNTISLFIKPKEIFTIKVIKDVKNKQ